MVLEAFALMPWYVPHYANLGPVGERVKWKRHFFLFSTR